MAGGSTGGLFIYWIYYDIGDSGIKWLGILFDQKSNQMLLSLHDQTKSAKF